jgi:hypothetical protein
VRLSIGSVNHAVPVKRSLSLSKSHQQGAKQMANTHLNNAAKVSSLRGSAKRAKRRVNHKSVEYWIISAFAVFSLFGNAAKLALSELRSIQEVASAHVAAAATDTSSPSPVGPAPDREVINNQRHFESYGQLSQFADHSNQGDIREPVQVIVLTVFCIRSFNAVTEVRQSSMTCNVDAYRITMIKVRSIIVDGGVGVPSVP